MIKSIVFSGKTEEEAIAAALAETGLERDEVSVEIVERAKAGFLGIGASPAVIKISFEQKDSIEDKTEDFLKGLLEKMGTQAGIEIKRRENGALDVSLVGNHMGFIIGRRGETLDAIQHLTNYAVNRGSENRVHINVDAENYRSKREESLVRLAEKMASKVMKYRRSMALEPMNSYERHVIHTALQEFEGVTTASTGTEPNRRVVVTYVGSKEGPKSHRVHEWS